MKNYYEILDVDTEATKEEIKTQYKKMAKLYHPDLNPKIETTDMFQVINEAAKTLLDKTKRDLYNKNLKLNNHFNKSKNNHIIEVIISKQEAENGAKRAVNFAKFILCPKCQGRGCKYCDSRGYDIKNSIINLIIPKNTQEDTVLRFENRLFKIKIRDNDDLKIINNIVYYNAIIKPYEAVLGAIIPIKTLWGQTNIKIPPLTKNNQRFKLIGVGVLDKTTGKKGEQIVIINVQIPKNITKKEFELYKKLKEVHENKG